MFKTGNKFAKWLPAIRISTGLVLLTVCVLLIADLIGIVPNEYSSRLESRKSISEALAIQFSTLASRQNESRIGPILEKIVERNPDILSAGIRDQSGRIVFQTDDHAVHWILDKSDHSTPDQVVVPIFQGRMKWGRVEITFEPIVWATKIGLRSNSSLVLIGFVSCTGFLGYLFVIRRTLRELDPSSVIPERVNAAFNTLEEGVLILDEEEQIVLANSAFAENLKRSTHSLLGLKASELPWQSRPARSGESRYPWLDTLHKGESRLGVSLELRAPDGSTKVFTINSAPIRDSNNKPRGVLITLDDVTEIIEKNEQLHHMVNKLEVSQAEVERQNKELHDLATKDSLTGCLNRRAFNEQFEAAFQKAKDAKSELSCIMTDIDHFKSVNDTYGHGVGDDVIKLLANTLQSNVRNEDFVGRYGGEEFCVVFPGLAIEETYMVAERIRNAVKNDSRKSFPDGPHITISLGVASMHHLADSPSELNNQADKALYVAKESGRNRVIKWDAEQILAADQDKKPSSGKTQAKPALPVPQSTVPIPQNADEPQRRLPQAEADRLPIHVRQSKDIAQKYSEDLQSRSRYDELTGLPNETLFFDRIDQALARAQRYNHTVALLSLGIEWHQDPDEESRTDLANRIFKELSERLTRTLRVSDSITLFRDRSEDNSDSELDSDEFGILLTDLTEVRPVTWILKRIFEAVSAPIRIDRQEILVRSSIGIGLYPEDSRNAEDLLNHASTARQHAVPFEGRTRYQMFDAQMHQISVTQLQIEEELLRAIENEEFVLHYQPKLELATSTISGVEALIRWDHSNKGLLPPYEFIGVAELSGLIVRIGDWVLRQACLQTRAWINMGMVELRVAVNISAVQLRQKDFAKRISEIVKNAGLSTAHIELEITESVILSNLDYATDMLNRLHEQGFRISIDDFGIGDSAFNRLKHLPFDAIKIDRALLHDIKTDRQDRAIVKTIIEMAHRMNIEVTAEGVENPEQLDLLRRYSCDRIQGYLFSRPVTASEVTKLLTEHTDQAVRAVR